MSRFDTQTLARAWASLEKPATEPVVAPVEDWKGRAAEICADLCRRFEGFMPRPYLCPAGVPTIGYGATYYLDGRPVKLTDNAISRETADRLLLAQIERVYMPAVLTLCPEVREPGRLAALTDFTFNLGEARLRASTLRRVVNAGQWDQAKVELKKWVYGGGKPLRGLVLRRQAEADLM